MPEGPECRKYAESLAQRVSSRKILGVEVLSGRYAKKTPGGLGSFKNTLPVPVLGAGCHGKFIYWILNDEYSIWSTLGMTGEWTTKKTDHSRVCFILDDGDVYFNDQRNFGTIKFVRGKYQLLEKLKSLGPDMLAETVDNARFINQLRMKQGWTIAKALMDQSVVAGVGNYIKAESLWIARISPHRTVDEMSDAELASLRQAVQQVMQESYSKLNATPEYRRDFLVYNQKNDPDGHEVVREQTDDGRTTHWVPAVQR